MTMTESYGKKSIPTAQELRRQVAHTREEFARTVEALASQTAAVKEQVAQVTGRLRDTAAHVGRLVEDKTPAPVRGQTVRAATQVRDTASRAAGRLAVDMSLDSVRGKAGQAAITARSSRTALIAGAGAGVLAAGLLVRRTRRAERGRRQR